MKNADALAILKTLRQSELDWMADEIEDAVESGKMVYMREIEPYLKAAGEAFAVVPIPESEELEVCLNAIKTYFVDLGDIWNSTYSALRESDTLERQESLKIKILDADGSTIDIFPADANKHKDQLNSLIREALSQQSGTSRESR